MRGRIRGFASAFASALAWAAVPAGALAQAPCPDPDVEAAPSEQAVCWYLEHTSRADHCSVQDDGASRCATEASLWCDRAALDDPGVASACVLAHVAAGRFDALVQVVSALPPGLSTEAEACRATFSRPVLAEITSNPPGGVVEVDGRALGPAPVSFELSHPLARHRVRVSFGETAEVLEGDALAERLDRRTCRLAPLLFVGPPPPPTDPTGPDEATARAPVVVEEAPRRPKAIAGGTLAAVGGGAAIAGVVALALAQRTATDLRADPEGTFWTESRSDDLSRVETLRPLGWAGVAVGAALVGLGIVLVVLDGDDEEAGEDGARERTTALRVGPGGLTIGGRF